MRMTFDDCVKELLLNKEDDTYVLTKETTDFAIDIMRKYQKFQDQSLSLYMERLKSDMVAMLTEIQLEIEELEPLASDSVGFDMCVLMSSDIIQHKINALKAESEDQDGQTSN